MLLLTRGSHSDGLDPGNNVPYSLLDEKKYQGGQRHGSLYFLWMLTNPPSSQKRK